MNEILDANGFEIVGACGVACYNEFCTAVEVLECFGSECCILVIAGAKHNYIGTLGESGINAFLYGIEAEIVDDFIAGTAEEIGGELSTGQTHGEVADSEHKHFRTLCCCLGSKTQCLEIGSGTLHAKSVGTMLH